ncbi:hypothetical protein [Micromonospora sp. NBC_00858]|uniref:hypothetical protein n=1 Tax=Micromonospora sp. NBC_00858 TaxID=2975979 RepID=UPI0038659A4C|nr:hypothetical protein OG990_23450 [Micromonospora sp. NBC_00858]
MQPESPYRYTHLLGACQVGKAWAAVDGQGQFATVAVLDGVAASDQRWREAFGTAANALAQAAGGHQYAAADLSAAHPWVAYRAEQGHAPQRLFQSLGMDYQPVPDVPVSAPPSSAPPVSGVPQQASGPPQSQAPELVSEMPQLPWAVHMSPVSGQPVSASPQPVSAAPASPAPPPVSAAPQSPAYTPSVAPVPSFDPLSSSGGRRIAPVARPQRSRTGLWVGAIILTAVLAGGAGLLGGGALSGDAKPASQASASPPAPLFEKTQYALNKAKFDPDLVPLAEPWLGRMGDCASDREAAGPKLPKDEKRHVFCRYGNVSVHFALFESTTTKDAARAYREQLAFVAGTLSPGIRQGARTTGGASGATGSYVEYAGDPGDGRPVMCGIWWDRDDRLGSVYFETPCDAGIGGNWDALRDLWHRNS